MLNEVIKHMCLIRASIATKQYFHRNGIDGAGGGAFVRSFDARHI